MDETVLSNRWFPIPVDHPEHRRIWASEARFDICAAGRRSFKTEILGKRRPIMRLLGSPLEDAKFGWCAPTHDQAKAIFWNDLKAMVPSGFIKEIREAERAIIIHPNKRAAVMGLDKPQRIEGQIWDHLTLDEIDDCKPNIWEAHVLPALDNVNRPGSASVLGVPEGKRILYKLWSKGKDGDPEYAAYHWKSAEVLPAEVIDKRRADMDPVVFRREYEASFEEYADRAYYGFSRAGNCELESGEPVSLTYSDSYDLDICFDFNKAPGVAAVVQRQSAEDYDRAGQTLPESVPDVFDAYIGEVFIEHSSTTPMVCRRLAKDWAHHEGRVNVYGDATGGAGGSAKVMGSDWDLVKAELQRAFPDRVRYHVPRQNPRERVRVNALNSRFQASDGTTHSMVDPRKCPHLVHDLESVGTIPGSAGEIDKKTNPNLTHISDAIGYRAEALYPLGGGVKREAI